jgi:zinc protease
MTDLFNPDGALHPSDLSPGLHLAVLPNGLKVIIKEDHRSAVAICNAWVKVGSNREPLKLRGWSHGIEHMLFKGTEKRDEGDFAKEVAFAGGSTNAGTGYETTNYHITSPVAGLPKAVDILSDALFNSSFDAESLDAERQVLVHENHMYDDIPFGFGVTWRWGMELGFDNSPYSNPIGGKDENLLERSRDDILAFWHSSYRPDNMTVVICGDVDPQQTYALVMEKFGPARSPQGQLDPEISLVASPPTEPSHDHCRLRVEYGDIKRAYAKLLFRGPGETDNQSAILSVARRVLNDGRSCRLHRQVQEELKLVDDYTVMTETGPREGAMLVDMETDPTRLPEAIKAVATILNDLAVNGCTEKELDRARVRVNRSFLFGEETVQGQASTLGHNEVMGDLASAFNFPQQVAAVTSDDVAAFCRQYFRLNELSCVIYLPEGTDPAAFGIPVDSARLNDLLNDVLQSGDADEKIRSITIQTPGKSTSKTASIDQPFETHHLKGGSEVCLRRDPALPIMTMALTTRGGSTSETAQNCGLSTLTQMVQVKGTGKLKSEEIFEALEGDGASIGPRTERDFTGLFISALSDRLDLALDYTGRLINAPSFPEHEIDQERRLAMEQLAALQDNPFQAAAVRLRKLIYGEHPYGRPLAGTPESLPLLNRDMLLAQHAATWTSGNLHITASGSFDPDDLLQRLEVMLEDLPCGESPEVPQPGVTNQPDGVVTERLTRQQNQSIVLTAWPGPVNVDEDRTALMMMKEVLNGQAGRLFEYLRNRNSLCYNTGTMSTAGFGQGMFLSYVLTAPDTEQDAREAMLKVLGEMTLKEVETEEFEMARAQLLGGLLIGNQSGSARVSRTSRDRLFGRDANDLDNVVRSIEQCTPAMVLEAAKKYITVDQRFEVSIGPR